MEHSAKAGRTVFSAAWLWRATLRAAVLSGCVYWGGGCFLGCNHGQTPAGGRQAPDDDTSSAASGETESTADSPLAVAGPTTLERWSPPSEITSRYLRLVQADMDSASCVRFSRDGTINPWPSRQGAAS